MLGSGHTSRTVRPRVSALPSLAAAHLALWAVLGLTFFAAAVAFLRPPPQATAAVKNPDHIGRVVGSGPMLERNTVLNLAVESAVPAVGAYERLVAQAHEQAPADADAGALPGSAVERGGGGPKSRLRTPAVACGWASDCAGFPQPL